MLYLCQQIPFGDERLVSCATCGMWTERHRSLEIQMVLTGTLGSKCAVRIGIWDTRWVWVKYMLWGRIIDAPSQRCPTLYKAHMKAGKLFWIWTGYIVALSMLILSFQLNTVSDRVFFGPTMCRANENEVSAINWLTLKSDSELLDDQRCNLLAVVRPGTSGR